MNTQTLMENYIRRLDDKILRFNTLRSFGPVSSSECDFDFLEIEN